MTLQTDPGQRGGFWEGEDLPQNGWDQIGSVDSNLPMAAVSLQVSMNNLAAVNLCHVGFIGHLSKARRNQSRGLLSLPVALRDPEYNV